MESCIIDQAEPRCLGAKSPLMKGNGDFDAERSWKATVFLSLAILLPEELIISPDLKL